jgi:hypothetical protein
MARRPQKRRSKTRGDASEASRWIDVRKWLRAAQQRFTAAEVLSRNQLHLDAIYLAGYSAECTMKAVLLSRVPEQNRVQ